VKKMVPLKANYLNISRKYLIKLIMLVLYSERSAANILSTETLILSQDPSRS